MRAEPENVGTSSRRITRRPALGAAPLLHPRGPQIDGLRARSAHRECCSHGCREPWNPLSVSGRNLSSGGSHPLRLSHQGDLASRSDHLRLGERTPSDDPGSGHHRRPLRHPGNTGTPQSPVLVDWRQRYGQGGRVAVDGRISGGGGTVGWTPAGQRPQPRALCGVSDPRRRLERPAVRRETTLSMRRSARSALPVFGAVH